MLAYFARRIVGGVVTLFLTGLIMHTLIVYMPGGNKDIVSQILLLGGRPFRDPLLLERVYGTDYGIYKPWPIGYLAWLFDPAETTEETAYDYDDRYGLHMAMKGIDVSFGDFHLLGSGVLTGDLGRSVSVEAGQSVADVFGKGLGEFMLLLVLTLPLSIMALGIQRHRRPRISGLPNYPQSRNFLPQYAHPTRVPGL